MSTSPKNASVFSFSIINDTSRVDRKCLLFIKETDPSWVKHGSSSPATGRAVADSHSSAPSHCTCQQPAQEWTAASLVFSTYNGLPSNLTDSHGELPHCPHLGVKASESERASKASHLISFYSRLLSFCAVPQVLCTAVPSVYNNVLLDTQVSLHHFHSGFCSKHLLVRKALHDHSI